MKENGKTNFLSFDDEPKSDRNHSEGIKSRILNLYPFKSFPCRYPKDKRLDRSISKTKFLHVHLDKLPDEFRKREKGSAQRYHDTSPGYPRGAHRKVRKTLEIRQETRLSRLHRERRRKRRKYPDRRNGRKPRRTNKENELRSSRFRTKIYRETKRYIQPRLGNRNEYV